MICRYFKPSDGLEPETPSLPCAPKALPWVATGCRSACLSRFRPCPICDPLPRVAPAWLHKCSTLVPQSLMGRALPTRRRTRCQNEPFVCREGVGPTALPPTRRLHRERQSCPACATAVPVEVVRTGAERGCLVVGVEESAAVDGEAAAADAGGEPVPECLQARNAAVDVGAPGAGQAFPVAPGGCPAGGEGVERLADLFERN